MGIGIKILGVVCIVGLGLTALFSSIVGELLFIGIAIIGLLFKENNGGK